MNHKDLIIGIIKSNHKSTNGSCGISIIQIRDKSGLSYNELKPILRTLYDEKKIKVREGINLKLVYFNE